MFILSCSPIIACDKSPLSMKSLEHQTKSIQTPLKIIINDRKSLTISPTLKLTCMYFSDFKYKNKIFF